MLTQEEEERKRKEFYSLPQVENFLTEYSSYIEESDFSEEEQENLLSKHYNLKNKLLYNLFLESSNLFSGDDNDKVTSFLESYKKILMPSGDLLDQLENEKPYPNLSSIFSKASDESISAKKFHRKSIPYLLKQNDEKYHLPEEQVLSHLENDKLYNIYQKCLSKLKVSHSPKMLKRFLKAYFKSIKK